MRGLDKPKRYHTSSNIMGSVHIKVAAIKWPILRKASRTERFEPKRSFAGTVSVAPE